MVLLPPFDLHVLGLPLAFILSQDQTLHCIKILILCEHKTMSSADPTRVNELFNSLFLRVVFSSLPSKEERATKALSFVFPSIQRTCVASHSKQRSDSIFESQVPASD